MATVTARSNVWIWWICGLLLMASTINYMDRQTLSNTSKRITEEFHISEQQYGNLELAFGLAFAAGSIIFGIIADRTSIRWLYPVVLLLWSSMGFATGFVETYAGLLTCRLFLGLFEAGHWPCALKTTQRLLPPDRRTLGNSVLQSGTAIGAIVTPLIIKKMLAKSPSEVLTTSQGMMESTLTTEPGAWRPVFQVIGAIGALWVILWLVSVRARDFQSDPSDENLASDPKSLPETRTSAPDLIGHSSDTILRAVFSRKFLVLLVVIVSINSCWHLFRVWLPKLLQQGRGYSETAMLDFNFWFNVMTDVGCLSAGAVTTLLAHRGWTVHGSRSLVFGVCTVLVGCGGLIPWLPSGPALLSVLLLVGAGALGLFPCYYSLAQEITNKHLGVLSGLLGAMAWICVAPLHPLFGRWIDQSGSFDIGMAMASLLPLAGLLAILCLWPRIKSSSESVGNL